MSSECVLVASGAYRFLASRGVLYDLGLARRGTFCARALVGRRVLLARHLRCRALLRAAIFLRGLRRQTEEKHKSKKRQNGRGRRAEAGGQRREGRGGAYLGLLRNSCEVALRRELAAVRCGGGASGGGGCHRRRHARLLPDRHARLLPDRHVRRLPGQLDRGRVRVHVRVEMRDRRHRRHEGARERGEVLVARDGFRSRREAAGAVIGLVGLVAEVQDWGVAFRHWLRPLVDDDELLFDHALVGEGDGEFLLVDQREALLADVDAVDDEAGLVGDLALHRRLAALGEAPLDHLREVAVLAFDLPALRQPREEDAQLRADVLAVDDVDVDLAVLRERELEDGVEDVLHLGLPDLLELGVGGREKGEHGVDEDDGLQQALLQELRAQADLALRRVPRVPRVLLLVDEISDLAHGEGVCCRP